MSVSSEPRDPVSQVCVPRISVVFSKRLLSKEGDLTPFNPVPKDLKTKPNFSKTHTNKLNLTLKEKNYSVPLLRSVRSFSTRA